MTFKKSKVVLCFLSLAMLCTTVFTDATPTYSEVTQESQATEEKAKTSDFITSGRIWIAGDSIAADHGYEDEDNYARFVHGWGEMIGNYLTEDAEVFNLAISGQTAKFFTEESNYQQIMDGIGEGDFLLVQFGHNDYKSDGTDHWELPTSTEGSYKWYLKHYYIDPALEAGAMPVLCTSVVQCRADAETGVIGDEQAQKKFAIAMRTIYEEYCEAGIEIGFIDTYALTQTYLNSSSVNRDYYYAEKYDRGNKNSTSLDRVHFSEAGANMTANMIAQNLMLMYEDFNRFSYKGTVDGGTGTKEDPYLISTWCQLYQIMQDDTRNTPDIYYKLTNNLYPMLQQQEWKTVWKANLDGGTFKMYNAVGNSLSAVFDENYGTISNLNLSYNLNHTSKVMQALFVKENYGTIRQCTASGNAAISYFEGTFDSVWNLGTFACVNHEGAAIEECSNYLDVTAYGTVPNVFLGGVAGYNKGTISKCNNTGELIIDTYEYDTSVKNPTYPQVVCCSGGIAGITVDASAIDSSTSSELPVNKTTLVNNVNVILAGNIVPVTEEELQGMLEALKPSEEPNVSLAPETSQKPDNSQEPQPGVSDNPVTVLKGDLNSDKQVTLPDAQTALKIALRIMEPENDNQLKAADLNADGAVSMDEVQEILKASLKITTL